MDLIEIRNIQAFGRHGASEAERSREQRFDINVRIALDLEAAAHTDVLDQTVNYAMLRDRVVATVQQRSFRLLERLALELLTIVFEDVRVAYARVSVAKPGALDGATPLVILRRDNPGYAAR